MRARFWWTRLSEAFFAKLFKLRFRYDIFISYSRHDGRDYALKLKEQLNSLDFSCFLDYEELPAGNSLNRTLTRAIARSATAVVVGTDGAVKSRYVGLEVSEFAHTGRPLVPIDFEGSLSRAPWEVIKGRDLVWIDESSAAAVKGLPSPQVADSIDKLFTYTRRNVRVRGQIAATALLFVLGAIVSSVLVEREVRVARAAQHDARVQQDKAKDQERLAQDATTRATAEQARAVSERQRADTARAAADVAETRAKEETRRAEEQALATRTGFSNLLSVEARTLVDTQPSLSTLLAVEAIRATRPDDPRVIAAEATLRETITKVGGRALASGGQSITGVDYLERALRQKVENVAISPDQRWAADAIPAGVRVFDLHAADPVATMRLIEKVQGPVAFTVDGRRLITAAADPEFALRLMDLSAPSAQPVTLGGFDTRIHVITLSPDGRWLVGVSETRPTARLWDLTTTPPRPITLQVGQDTDRDGVIVLAISPDSHWLAASAGASSAGNYVLADHPGQVRVWDLHSSQPATTVVTLPGHKQVVTELAFSPDSHRLATASYECDAGVRVWDLISRDPAARPTVVPHEGSIGALAFSADARWLATGSGRSQNCASDSTARIWKLPGGDGLGEAKPIVLSGHEGPIFDLDFSPDNSVLIAAAGGGNSGVQSNVVASVRGMRRLENNFGSATAHFWYLGRTLQRQKEEDEDEPDPSETPHIVLRDPAGAADAFAMSPDRRFVVARSRSSLLVWDLFTSPEAYAMGMVPTTLRGHDASLRAVAFTPDGRWLISRDLEQGVRLWDLTAGANAATPRRAGTNGGDTLSHDSLVLVSADRRLIVAAGGADAYAWMLDAHGAGAPRRLRGHTGPIKSLNLSADHRWLATGGTDRTARLWDLEAADPSAHPRVFTHATLVSEVVLGPGHRWLATTTEDGVVRLWNLTATTPQATELTGGIHAQFSADGHWLLTSGDYMKHQRARLWDLTAPAPAATPIELANTQGEYCRISPDSRWLLIERALFDPSRGSDESFLWDLRHGPARTPFILRGPPNTFVASSVFSPDGRWLYTSGYNQVVRRWDLAAPDPATTAVVLSVPASDPKTTVGTITLSPDGRWLTATGSEQGQYFLWDLHGPGRIAHALQNPLGLGVSNVAFTPDSRWLLTSHDSIDLTGAGSGGGNMLWNLDGGELVPVPIPGRQIISNAAFSADARWLVTRGLTTLELWPMRLDTLLDLACRTAGRDLSQREWDTYFTGQRYRKTCASPPTR